MGPDRAVYATLTGAISGTVELEPERIAYASRDASGLVGRADAVVRPEGVEDLVRLVRWAVEHRVPIIPRGAGTSLDGSSVPVLGGLVVDLSGWDRILEVDLTDRVARVGPGTVNRRLDAELASKGFTYPPNPGSGTASTLGGNVATNASGFRSLRHGPTRAWVRALEVVDGTGARWTAGGRSAKSSVGPDLVSLLVGSEGTLGLFSEVTVRIVPRPERRTGLALPLADGRPLGPLLQALRDLLGTGLSALEFVDAGTSDAMRVHGAGAWPFSGAMLLAEFEGSSLEEAEALGRLEAARRALGLPSDLSVFPEADRLWALRSDAGPALEAALGPPLREDLVVPLARLDDLRTAISAIRDRFQVPVLVFGHVGEGNLHPVFGTDPRSETADRIRRALCDSALSLGGGISGEHGVGATKRDRLEAQLGPSGIGALRALKGALDPHGILNPGKLLPELAP